MLCVRERFGTNPIFQLIDPSRDDISIRKVRNVTSRHPGDPCLRNTCNDDTTHACFDINSTSFDVFIDAATSRE